MTMRRFLLAMGVCLYGAAHALGRQVPAPSQTDSLEIRAGEAVGRVATSQPVAMPSLGLDITRMFAALLIVIGLILLTRWVLKRFYAGTTHVSGNRAVQVLNRTFLAPKQQILLLQVGRRVVVVGESNGNLSTLAQIDDPDEIAQLIGKLGEERLQRPGAFGGLFGKAQRKLVEEPSENEHATVETGDEPPSPEQVRSELSGLLEKVKSLRGQIGRD